MQNKSKTLKRITETTYLNTENTARYRALMRIFYRNDQSFRHWLKKEQVYQQLQSTYDFEDYTLELCASDLDKLVEWGNLTTVQDTSKVSTYQQFINKQYRYQMTEYAIEI